MAKSKSTNRHIVVGTYQQVIYNEPRRLLVGSYLTPKGEREMAMASNQAQIDVVNAKYRKNRYKLNPNCTRIVGVITHQRLQ